MKLLFTILNCFGFAFINVEIARAQDQENSAERYPAQTIIQDQEIIAKAKSHNYRGGAEEGELRVQALLPKAQRKIAPVIDKTETEPESQDHD